MSTETITVFVVLAIALILGTLTARSSNRREAIHGGPLAQVFNWAASVLMVATLPTVLAGVFVLDIPWAQVGGIWIHPTVQVIGLAFSFFITAFLLLMIYALFEKPALQKAQEADQGWTEEDARTSGL